MVLGEIEGESGGKGLETKQAFVEYAYRRVAGAIRTWDPTVARDIYVVWLMLYLWEDDCRRVEIIDIRYGTRAHSSPDLIESYGSKWSPSCAAGGTDLRLCAEPDDPGWDFDDEPDPGDPEGRALRDAFLAATVTRFDGTDREKDDLWEHASLLYRRQTDPNGFLPADRLRLDELESRLGVTDVERSALEEDGGYLRTLRSEAFLNPILDVLAEIIQRLHAERILETVCGAPVPVGIGFVNDMSGEVVADAVRRGNPPGLAREMEEFLMERVTATRLGNKS